MLTQARRSALCSQALPAAFTGIDFIRVADSVAQNVLHVFFIVDPGDTKAAAGGGVFGVPGNVFDLAPPNTISIVGALEDYRSAPVTIVSAEWINDAASERTVLKITVEQPGDFSDYRLTIEHPAIDRFFRSIRFSFKQACPSTFDCRDEQDCPQEPTEQVLVDYMARDFDSFRSAAIDFTARRYPQWQEKIAADCGMMITEVLCALADEFSYMQDRIAREAHFSTATQRRSLHHMARLVDYNIDRGECATTWLSFTITGDNGLNVAPQARAGQRIVAWALTERTEQIPFEALVPAEPDDEYGDDHFWLHPRWNEMNAYMPDPDRPCLTTGATELHIAPMEDGLSPLTGTLNPSSARPEADNWVGRRVILNMDPADPSRPHRRWAVTVTEVEIFSDPIAAAVPGMPYEVTRITWDRAEALPFEMSLPDTRVYANNLLAVAGKTVEKLVRTGDNVPAEALTLEKAMVRESARHESAIEETASPRRFNRRVGLEASLNGGLAFNAKGQPFVTVEQIDGVGAGATVIGQWRYTESLIEAGAEDEQFTLEPGLWTKIRRFERLGEVVHHSDYASNEGFTVLFGDGELGAGPAEDALLRITYRLNPGSGGNVPSHVVNALTQPGTNEAPLGGNYPSIESVLNRLPASGGHDEEPPDHIRRFAPVVYRSRPLRAMTDADFQSILSQLSFAQAVGARQRWTGSWLTRNITADPLDSYHLSAERKALLLSAGHSIRRVGSHIEAVDPLYRPMDLSVTICIKPDAYFGQVKKQVIAALTTDNGADDKNGIFHPNNFTFGTELSRSSVEAAIQRVPGVLGVKRICIKPHQDDQWREFTGDALRVGVREIIQIRNDPRFPDQGTIAVYDHQQMLEPGRCN